MLQLRLHLFFMASEWPIYFDFHMVQLVRDRPHPPSIIINRGLLLKSACFRIRIGSTGGLRGLLASLFFFFSFSFSYVLSF